MRISWNCGNAVTGIILIFTGILLVNVNTRLPIIKEITPGDNIGQLIIGIVLIIIGFIVFKKPLNKLLENKNYDKKAHSKPKNAFLELFGLD